jgi:hypothetical protein
VPPVDPRFRHDVQGPDAVVEVADDHRVPLTIRQDARGGITPDYRFEARIKLTSAIVVHSLANVEEIAQLLCVCDRA